MVEGLLGIMSLGMTDGITLILVLPRVGTGLRLKNKETMLKTDLEELTALVFGKAKILCSAHSMELRFMSAISEHE